MPQRAQRDSLTSVAASRRAERTALWQDSSFFQDSFFAPDARDDPFAASEFQSLPGGSFGAGAPEGRDPARDRSAGDDDPAGAGADTPRSGPRMRH
jgi:hypothetical protein